MQKKEKDQVTKESQHSDYKPPRLTVLQIMAILIVVGILLTWILKKYFS